MYNYTGPINHGLISYAEGWVDYRNNYEVPVIFQNGNMVEVQGLCRNTIERSETDILICTLPEHLRPEERYLSSMCASGNLGVARLDIHPDGAVIVRFSEVPVIGSWVSLDVRYELR